MDEKEDKDDIDDDDDDDDDDDNDNKQTRFGSNTTGHGFRMFKRIGSGPEMPFMTSRGSAALLFSFSHSPSASGTIQVASRQFSSSLGTHSMLFGDFGNNTSSSTQLPPPPAAKRVSESQVRSKEQEREKLEMKIKELEEQVEKLSKEKEEKLSSLNNDQGQSSHQNVKGERSEKNDAGEEERNLLEKSKEDVDVVTENVTCAPVLSDESKTVPVSKSADIKEVPISTLLKKHSYSKAEFNHKEFLNSVFSNPLPGAKRVQEREKTAAWSISPGGPEISSKIHQRPRQPADEAWNDFWRDGSFKERNMDHDSKSMEDGVFENKFHEVESQQNVVEISLPLNQNIPHTRGRKTVGHTYSNASSDDLSSVIVTDSKSSSVDGFENIPNKVLSSNEAPPNSNNQSVHSSETMEIHELPPLKYPDHSPLDLSPGNFKKPSSLSKSNSTESEHNTQLPPKRKSNEMSVPLESSSTLPTEFDEDENSSYQEYHDSNRKNYKKATGSGIAHSVSPYTSYVASLQSLADHNGYIIKDVTPDGNCMFSAIIDQLRIQGNFDLTPNSLRKTAVDYLKENPKNQDGTHLESFLSTETWDEYLKRMGQESQWGDHMVLQACTEVTGHRIVVFKQNTNKTVLVPTYQESSENDILTLGHVGESHFVSLRPKDWEANWPLMAHAHRAKMKEKQKLARKKSRKRKKSKDKGKTPSPAMSDKEDSTSVEEKGMTSNDTPEGTTKEVVTESEPIEDEVDDESEEEAESEDPKVKTTDDDPDLMSDDPDLLSDDLDLVLNPVAIDTNSGIPLPHLSFLLRQFVKPSYLCVEIPKNIPSFCNMGTSVETYVLGSLTEGFCVHFIDYTDPPQLTSPVIYCPSVVGVCKEVLVRLQCDYQANDADLFADTTLTHPGYVHLVPVNERLWPDLVTYIEKKPFLSHITLAIDDSSVSAQMQNKVYTGYKCASWPECAMEWFSRNRLTGWPGNEIMHKILNTECLVISRSHLNCIWPNMEYQFVFPKAEAILAKNALMYEQRLCFNAFKTLVDFSLRNSKVKLSTTHLKSVMYNACETIPLSSWGHNSGACLIYLLDSLRKQLQARNIPNYFISQNNMVDHLDEEAFEMLLEHVTVIRKFPVMALYHIMEHHDLRLSWMASLVLDDLPLFLEHRQINRTVREAFVPAVLHLAKLFFYDSKYKDGYSTAQDAYSEFLMQVPDEEYALENHPTEGDQNGKEDDFRKILHNVVKKEVGDNRHFLAYHFDTGLGTSILEDLFRGSDIKTIAHLIGNEAAGPLALIPIPPGVYGHIGKELSFLDTCAYRMFQQKKMDIAVSVLRGGIQKGNKERESSVIEISDITDENMKKDIAKQTYSIMSTFNCQLANMYNHLYACYSEMGSIELLQEVIEDYEDLCDMIGLPYFYQDVVEIWYKLGNIERSRQAKRKLKALSSSSEFINEVWHMK